MGHGDYDEDDIIDESQEEDDYPPPARAHPVRQQQSVQHQQTPHRRTRRQAKKKLLEKELNCGATKCTVIRCTAGPLTTSNNVVFKLRARVWAQTISEIDWEDLVISSKMVVDITELPYGVDSSFIIYKTATVTTPLDQLDREREAKAIPWWIIVLAAVAGVLLLLLLIFILWKLGFFKRKRPDKDDPDHEPLKSENGHLQRDEAL